MTSPTDTSFHAATKATAIVIALLWAVIATPSLADTKIKVGRSISPSVYELPSYVAMEKGYFKREGLEAEFVPLTRRALVTGGIAAQAVRWATGRRRGGFARKRNRT